MQAPNANPQSPPVADITGPTIIERGILTAISLIFMAVGVLMVASGSGLLPEGMMVIGG